MRQKSKYCSVSCQYFLSRCRCTWHLTVQLMALNCSTWNLTVQHAGMASTVQHAGMAWHGHHCLHGPMPGALAAAAVALFAALVLPPYCCHTAASCRAPSSAPSPGHGMAWHGACMAVKPLFRCCCRSCCAPGLPRTHGAALDGVGVGQCVDRDREASQRRMHWAPASIDASKQPLPAALVQANVPGKSLAGLLLTARC